jgi:hypothetical protein
MDVQPDDVWADPDYELEEEDDDDDDEDEDEIGAANSDTEFTSEEDVPVVYRRVRGWDRVNLRVIWRTIQQSILGDSDSDYIPSDDETQEE